MFNHVANLFTGKIGTRISRVAVNRGIRVGEIDLGPLTRDARSLAVHVQSPLSLDNLLPGMSDHRVN